MRVPLRLQSARGAVAGLFVLLIFVMHSKGSLATETSSSVQLLDWVEIEQTAGLVEQLRDRMSRLTTFFVRITSPDVPRESRHVWKLSVDGSQSCRLSNDTGVRYPRWGASGYILYLQEADTNHDGRIDFRDDFLIRVVHQQGGVAKTVGQSRSAVWSPDGKYVAFVQKSKVYIVGVTGEAPPRGTVLRGEIIATNSRNPEAARDFWAIDPQSGAETALPSDPAKKYLWLGQLAPSGSQIVFTNTMKTTLETREVENNISRVVDRGDFHFMDPAWSPDEKQIVYVSDRPTDQHPCWDF